MTINAEKYLAIIYHYMLIDNHFRSFQNHDDRNTRVADEHKSTITQLVIRFYKGLLNLFYPLLNSADFISI